MKILVTGAQGQLGTAIVRKLSGRFQIEAFNSRQLDISDEKQVLQIITQIKPAYIINCAAYNNVNQAELHSDKAIAVNELGVYHLAKAAELMGAVLIHISTDYIFDGQKKSPYIEEDMPNPLNVYGMSKYKGELLIQEMCSKYIILRTSWLYSEKENNFPHAILRLAKEKNHLKVISDHIGTPSNTEELARVIQELIEDGVYGIYNCSGNGQCSWYEFAKKTMELAGINCNIQPIKAMEYKEPAKKPAYSVLDNTKIQKVLGFSIRQWEEALEWYFKNNQIK